VVFIVDDLLGWLVGLVADTGRKKLVTLVLGSDQERALRQATVAAVEATAAQLAPSGEQADQLAIAVGKVFRGAPKVALAGQGTLLEALQAGIAGRVAVLEDPAATGTGQSAMGLLGVPAGVLAERLAGHLVHEITVRGAQGGPLTPLADQLNHDMTHLQGQRLEGMLAQVVSLVTELAQAGRGPQVPRKPVRLAPRPVFLAGREELLADLDAKLAGGDDAGPLIVALSGLGGAGKTSVALEYAHRHLAEVGLAWQFHAEDTAVLENEFGQLAAQLGIRELLDALDSVHGVLAAYPAEWLLVFDNATDRKAVERFLPPAGRGRVLVTSRSALWRPGQAVEVPVLDAEVAADYLVRLTDDADRRAALELAGELGRLPLALEQAGAYVQASGGSLARYLASFRKRRPELLARGEEREHGKTVATTWSLAFTELEQSEPQAAGLLRLLAFCAPEPVPLHLLLQPRPGLADELADEVAAIVRPLLGDELAAGDAVVALRRYSLVTLGGEGLVLVHRLVQAVTADQMPAGLADQWRRAAAALVEAAIPEDTDLPAAWPVCAVLLPHARAVLDLTSGGMRRIADYLGQSGSFLAARDLWQLIARAHGEDDNYGPEHPDTLTACRDLARWTGEAGNAAGARDQLAALLPILERVLGPEHPDGLTARRDLAYWTAQAGDWAAARDQFASLLPIHERVLGPEHPRTLADRSGLAVWTGQAGDAAGARDQFAALVPIEERVLGAEHPDTLADRANLAYWTGTAGDAAGARDQLAALLPVMERVSRADHPYTLAARARLAYWTGAAGDAATARDQYTALLPVIERVWGPEHPETLIARGNLAVWTGQAGDAAGARDQLAALLPVRDRVSFAEDPDTLTERARLAHWTGKAGDAAGARDQYAALLLILKRVLGPEHPETQAAQGKLAYWIDEADRDVSRGTN
jgi:Tetratricopeptide repeat